MPRRLAAPRDTGSRRNSSPTWMPAARTGRRRSSATPRRCRSTPGRRRSSGPSSRCSPSSPSLPARGSIASVAAARSRRSSDRPQRHNGPMRDIVKSIEEEYLRYKALGESALAQVTEADLSKEPPGNGNSLAALVWHIAGNLESRFTDFRTADGEKPTRDRDSEFVPREVTRAELMEEWQRGWAPLIAEVHALTDADLPASIVIRTQPLRID